MRWRVNVEQRAKWPEWTGWGCVLVLAYTCLVFGHCVLKDADSTLYELIASQLSRRPFEEWLNPLWPEGRFKQGPFQEHLAVFFWPAALLERIGLPRGALCANLVYVLLNLWALGALTGRLFGEKAQTACLLFAVCSPLFLQYLIRANQEPLWSACTLWALYGLVRAEDQTSFRLLFWATSGAAFLMKGVLALLLFPAALAFDGLWAVRSPRRLALRVGALGSIAAIALLYEWAYRSTTGLPFFSSYLGAQLAYVGRAEGAGVWRKLFNVPFYAANALYFAAPASLVVLAWMASPRPLHNASPGDEAQSGTALHPPSDLAAGALGASPTPQVLSTQEQWNEGRRRAWALLRFTATWLLCAALPTRSAVRYGFPAYQLLFACAGFALPSVWPSLAQWIDQRRRKIPFLAMVLVLTMVIARCLLDPGVYRFINVERAN